MWHNDEFPYIYSDRCTRGQSYYTSNPYANITTIDIDPPKESLLDYDGRVLFNYLDPRRQPCDDSEKGIHVKTYETICYFCVCGVDGFQLDCIKRDNWFCEYYRDLRNDTKNYYRWRDNLKYDRQSYFRELSFRLRRNMDNAMFDYLDDGIFLKSFKGFVVALGILRLALNIKFCVIITDISINTNCSVYFQFTGVAFYIALVQT